MSPMTNYYIRKLYHQKDSYLSKFEDMDNDLSASLDIGQILKQLYKDSELNLMISQLETLVQYHQGLTSQSSATPAQVKEVEQRIFAILGLVESQQDTDQSVDLPTQIPPSPPEPKVTVAKLLSVLNSLQESGQTYLGAAVTASYLLESRPSDDWFSQLQIQKSQPITCSGDPSQTLETEQVDLARQWVRDCIQSCSHVLPMFSDIVDQTKLLSQL